MQYCLGKPLWHETSGVGWLTTWQTLCLAAYTHGEDSPGNHGHGEAWQYFGCHDPTEQSGHFNQTGHCVDGLFCWQSHDQVSLGSGCLFV